MSNIVWANRELPVYQLIGYIVRVHWDGVFFEHPSIDENEPAWSGWAYKEIVVPADYTPEQAAAIGVPTEVAENFLPKNFVREMNNDG